jgi:hypothetical protein
MPVYPGAQRFVGDTKTGPKTAFDDVILTLPSNRTFWAGGVTAQGNFVSREERGFTHRNTSTACRGATEPPVVWRKMPDDMLSYSGVGLHLSARRLPLSVNEESWIIGETGQFCGR